MEKAVRDYLKQIAKKGGESGKGKSKVRGGPDYYRRIALKAAAAKRAKKKSQAKQGRAAK